MLLPFTEKSVCRGLFFDFPPKAPLLVGTRSRGALFILPQEISRSTDYPLKIKQWNLIKSKHHDHSCYLWDLRETFQEPANSLISVFS